MEERIKQFQKRGFGLFVHYGAYVQYENGEWVMNLRQHDPENYEKKALELDYSSFDAKKVIHAAKISGAKYITFTTRHHDGFSLYDTRGLTDYDVMHTPNGKDIVKEFVDACHEADIMPFLYHTTVDWHHPDFDRDFPAYLQYLRDSIEILCCHYGEIGGFWLDGNWSKPAGAWELDVLYGIIRKYQPHAIIINNTGLEAQGVFGHEEIDCVTFEQGHPQKLDCSEMEKEYMGEMCYPICEHWGIATDINVKSMKQILEAMVACRRVGGNFLLGIFTKLDGSQPLLHEGYLEAIGKWVQKNEDAFFEGQVCAIKGYGKDFALETKDKVYLFLHDIPTWGDQNVIKLTERQYSTFTNVQHELKEGKWLDNEASVAFAQDREKGLLVIEPTPFQYGESWVIRVAVFNKENK
ncbi:alpha-L-fucosidase [Niameybacter massiliensis]|uniref:alpha-L-fucosidase n=1 Tax=Niameybacter massiliensis TaxID=1658108 RepID=UPI0006B47F27|nr:alpha-L-fucosidase [Niameybacter massiliensis]